MDEVKKWNLLKLGSNLKKKFVANDSVIYDLQLRHLNRETYRYSLVMYLSHHCDSTRVMLSLVPRVGGPFCYVNYKLLISQSFSFSHFSSFVFSASCIYKQRLSYSFNEKSEKIITVLISNHKFDSNLSISCQFSLHIAVS